MADGRKILTARLEQQLGTLVGSVEIAARNNLGSTYVVAETTLAGLLNRVYGWELVNANAGAQNYPGVDLIDEKNSIAVQVTATRTVKKVRHTLDEAAKLDVTFRRLILLIISNQPATADMKASAGPMEIWNIPDVLRAAKELDVKTLADITGYMDGELGSVTEKTDTLPHLELRPDSSLEATGFVGREKELADIRSRFQRGDKEVVLTGLGGMGKTELAARYGRKHPGMVYFVRFDTDFTHTLAGMASGIRPKLTDEELQQDDGTLCRRVLELLEQSRAEDLLIIDNADSPTGALADLLKDPVYGAIRTLPLRRLLTTRSHAPRAIEVAPMEPEPLFKIFENHGAELTRAEMEALIAAVNGHTLTVDLIARTLNGRGWRRVTAEDMLTALREHKLRERKYQKIATDYSQSPEQARIYEHLSVVFDMSGMSDGGKQVMRCASLLPEGGMDAELFGNSLEEAEQEALDTLLGQGWLEVRKGLMTIHPIIRLVCREELKPDEESCGDFLDALWGQLGLTEYDRVKFAQLAEVFENAMEISGTPQTKAEWLNNSGRLWHDLMESRRCAALYEAYIPVLEPQIPDNPALATAYNNVGITYSDLGDHAKALEYQQKALAIREKVLPPEHPDLATSYNNVGYTYGDLGDHAKALEYQQKALTIQEKVLPPEHPNLATSYNNVGMTYGDLGDHARALEYQQKALTIQEKVLPPEHPSLATSYNNVGGTYGDLGDNARALEYQLKALAIREKVLPPEHPDLAASYNNVGLTYGDLGDPAKALEYHQKALAIFEKVLPPEHPDLATSYNNVGMTYGALGDHTRALEYLLKALAIREKVLPPEHPDLATSYNNVGLTYGALGDHTKALEYKLKALTIWEKVLPPEHPSLATSYNNVGSTYGDLGDHAKALEYQLKALAIQEKSLPENHPYNAACCGNIAWTYSELGDLKNALDYIRRAADIADRSLPEGHPDRVNYRRWAQQMERAVGTQQTPLGRIREWASKLFPFGKK